MTANVVNDIWEDAGNTHSIIVRNYGIQVIILHPVHRRRRRRENGTGRTARGEILIATPTPVINAEWLIVLCDRYYGRARNPEETSERGGEREGDDGLRLCEFLECLPRTHLIIGTLTISIQQF